MTIDLDKLNNLTETYAKETCVSGDACDHCKCAPIMQKSRLHEFACNTGIALLAELVLTGQRSIDPTTMALTAAFLIGYRYKETEILEGMTREP